MSLTYGPKSIQGFPTLLALQPKTHAAAAKIFAEKFSPDKPIPESPSPRAPEPNHVAASLTLSPTTAEPYNQP